MEGSYKSLVIKILQKLDASPLRKYGQNFLISPSIISKLSRLIKDFQKKTQAKILFEIGPGFGFLIDKVFERDLPIVGIELDSKLANYLREKYSEYKEIQIEHADATKFDLAQLNRVLIYGNIPYNISSKIVDAICKNRSKIASALVMFQLEFANRLTSQDGSKQFGSLSVLAQLFYQVKKVFTISKENFWPVPNVTSSLVTFVPLNDNFQSDYDSISKILRICFGMRRKTLYNNIRSSRLIYKDFLLDFFSQYGLLSERAEKIPLEIWKTLFKKMSRQI
ncbi:MAG: 16S rRNA (adenine(1518)-N(6)/adenine(1519)-N(6))-dimethyltransferase RsmA [Deltaproteobacteria bacterium]|nr:16S rRNA (adenine(1518)-N(6)/adenine(1519)-N(6))-dimethyltransferase RsmA [Deltaproteobacteria bacterium]